MKIHSEQEMLDFGVKYAADLMREHRLATCLELVGDVGAGKTTFVRGLAKGLGISQPLTSPSFTIAKSYAFPIPPHSSSVLDHYDFYRLQHPGLMSDALDESIHAHHLVVIEWANTVDNILPAHHPVISFLLNPDGSRTIHITEDNSSPDTPSSSVISPNPLSSLPSSTPHHSSSTLHLYLDTSTPTTILKINQQEYHWDSGNHLAEQLLSFIHEKLLAHSADWPDITDITFMSGPGSFTGLRIGATIVNALAHELDIPLYDHHGKHHPLILPDYGRPANISAPQK